MMKKWSPDFDRCRICGTTERKHMAKGMCNSCYQKQWKKENPESIKQWRKENKEKIKQYNKQHGKQYYEKNKEIINKKNKLYNEKNKELVAQRKKQWALNNSDHLKLYRKRYYQENKDKIDRQVKQYRSENRELVRQREKASGKKYRDKNKEKSRERKRRWEKDNPEKARAYGMRRRAKKRNAEGNHTGKDRKFLMDLADNKCQCCGGSDRLAIDHIIPLSKNGSNGIFNLQVLCLFCNSSKGNHRNTDYRSLEFLQAVYSYRAEDWVRMHKISPELPIGATI